MSEYDDAEDGEDVWEEIATFAGTCTCDHERDQRGWGSCGVAGCECEAGWEE